MVKIPDEIKEQIYNEEVRRKMSEKKKEYFANMTPKQRSEFGAKISAARLKHSNTKIAQIKQLKEEVARYKAIIQSMSENNID